MPISEGFVYFKIYDKRDNFGLDILNLFLDGDIPHATTYGLYLSQLIRFARISGHLPEF